MLRQLLVGAGVSTSTIVIHAMIMATVVRAAYAVMMRKIWWLVTFDRHYDGSGFHFDGGAFLQSDGVGARLCAPRRGA